LGLAQVVCCFVWELVLVFLAQMLFIASLRWLYIAILLVIVGSGFYWWVVVGVLDFVVVGWVFVVDTIIVL